MAIFFRLLVASSFCLRLLLTSLSFSWTAPLSGFCIAACILVAALLAASNTARMLLVDLEDEPPLPPDLSLLQQSFFLWPYLPQLSPFPSNLGLDFPPPDPFPFPSPFWPRKKCSHHLHEAVHIHRHHSRGAFEKFEEITILLPVFASRSRPNRLPGRCALMKDVAPRSRA